MVIVPDLWLCWIGWQTGRTKTARKSQMGSFISENTCLEGEERYEIDSKLVLGVAGGWVVDVERQCPKCWSHPGHTSYVKLTSHSRPKAVE